jgi:hypothetical protein
MQLANAELITATALLKIDNLNLLVPQSEVRSLESAADIDITAPALHGVGWIAYAHKRVPVYNLSEELNLLYVTSNERRACVILTMGSGFIGVLCNDLIILKNINLKWREIPHVMRLTDTPVLALAEYEDRLVCMSNTHAITAYIERLVVQED